MKDLDKAKDQNAARLLAGIMSEISEDHYCAGWLDGLEVILWSMVQGGDRRFGFFDVTEEEIAELRMLSDAAGGWVVWNDVSTGKAFVTLEEWCETAGDRREEG